MDGYHDPLEGTERSGIIRHRYKMYKIVSSHCAFPLYPPHPSVAIHGIAATHGVVATYGVVATRLSASDLSPTSPYIPSHPCVATRLSASDLSPVLLLPCSLQPATSQLDFVHF